MSAEIHSMTCVFWLFKYTRDCFHTPAAEIGILVTVIPALRQSISRRRRDTFFRQDASDLRRTVAVNAKMENLANNFGGFIVDQPKVPVRFRMLIAVDRIRKMFARLSLSLENGSDLLARITSVPVIKNVLESHQLIFRL